MTTSVTGPEAALSTAVPTPTRSAPGIDTDRVAGLIAQLLVELGEDPARDGLQGTPGRVAAWWKAFLSPDGAAVDTCFTESQLSGQLVVVGGMNIWSLCEHHMLPMGLQVTAGYVPDGEVLGLSKFGRIAQRYAGQLQVQERFTRQVFEYLTGLTGHMDVAVRVRGTHLCMSMRGVRMDAALTTMLQAGGRFKSDPVLSQQFLTHDLGPARVRTAVLAVNRANWTQSADPHRDIDYIASLTDTWVVFPWEEQHER